MRWGGRIAPLAYLGLAIAVAAPLLASGLVLAVDLAQTPHPPIPRDYWGLPQGSHEGTLARLPLDALFAGLGQVDAVWIGQKLLLLAIVFLAGWGMHRLVRARTDAGGYFAGVLYAVNPFVFDRLYTGQWFLLLGYALLPLAYAGFRSILEGDRRGPWLFGALFLATAVASTHMAALLFGLCAVTVLAWSGRIRRTPRLGLGVLGGFSLAALPSLYWLVPTPGLNDFLTHIGDAQLELYRTTADSTWGLALTLAGLSGYWNNETPLRDYFPVWPIFALTLVAFAARGLQLRRADPTACAVAGAGVIGFLLALGYSSFLTRDAFSFLVDHVSVVRSFRESQKGVALLAFAYAFLGAAAVDDLVEETPQVPRRARLAVSVGLVALPLMFGYRVLGGLWGSLHTSDYPASWSAANERLSEDAGDSRTLFLPWSGYIEFGFNGGRVLANPAPSFFDSPILASRSVGEGSVREDVSDPTERRVDRLLRAGRDLRHLGACLAPLGVSHILLAEASGWRRYRFLDHQADIEVERRWPDLVLYRSKVPAGLVMAGRAERRCTTALRPLTVSEESPVRYRLPAPRPAGKTMIALPKSSEWELEGSSLRFTEWPRYRRNYLLGLGGAAVFLLTAAAAGRRRRSRRPR